MGKSIEEDTWRDPGTMKPLKDVNFMFNACQDLIIAIYTLAYRDLCKAYRARKNKCRMVKINGYEHRPSFLVRDCELFFLSDMYSSGIEIEGTYFIEKARKNVYGKNWRKHKDFKNRQEITLENVPKK